MIKIVLKWVEHFLTPLLIRSRWYNQRIFSQIYYKNLFNERASYQNSESRSGSGSNLQQTQELIEEIPKLLRKYDIHSVLDIPCGDFFWMRHVSLGDIRYIGADIVPKLVSENIDNFKSKDICFIEMDICSDLLPKVDLILCRDLFVHLKNSQIKQALRNIKRSGSKYLLTTSFTERKFNSDTSTVGLWRPLNLNLEPFNLPPAIDLIFENCTEAAGKFKDKHLLLYKIDDIES